MLEKGVLPFKKSLFSMLEDGAALDDIPFRFSIDVEPASESTAATHVAQLQVPTTTAVRSVEVNSVMLRVHTGSATRKVYMLLQRLDSDGEPRGPPIPIVMTDTTQCALSARFKLHTGDSIQLLLLQKGEGPSVLEVVFNGFLLRNPDSCFSSNAAPAALLSWKPDTFRVVEGEQDAETRKRARSSEKQQTSLDEDEDEIPILVYAPVNGGDDES